MTFRPEFEKTASALAEDTTGDAPDATSITVPGKEGLLVRSYPFVNIEMPVELMTEWITPVKYFYVRNHMFEPAKIDPATWKLTIGGEVEKRLTLSLGELENFPIHSVVNAMECAGNGRLLQSPKAPGVQWGKGAIGNAKFSGPSLKVLLEKAGVKDSGKHVIFHGLDEAPGKVPPFVRSIPIEKAMDGDTLIATHMNDAPLIGHHGFPARAVTPGWAGAASCKWLTEITVLGKPAEGLFMSSEYRMPNTPVKPGEAVKPEDTHAITGLTVKSLIAGPSNGAKLKPGTQEISGVAWAGEADITKVEISTDGGASWNPAQLGKDHAKYAWRLWSYAWKPAKSGDYVILSRATDSQGRVQPDAVVWNPNGYLYDACDLVKVYVQA